MKGRWIFAVLFALFAGALTASASASAAETRKEKSLGAFGAWHALTDGEGSQIVCYMVTAKIVKASDKKKDRKTYLMITHRPIEASSDVFSYGAGEALDTKHDVTLRVGKDSFDLFSVKETAWARDPMTDHKIAAAIRNSSFAQITAIPAHGRVTTIADKFSLTGALPAYRAISKACGLPDVVPVKKEAPKKAEVKKKDVKKAPVKKPEVQKPAAKKTSVKKSAAPKAAEKIPDLKKTATVKTTVKKTKASK